MRGKVRVWRPLAMEPATSHFGRIGNQAPLDTKSPRMEGREGSRQSQGQLVTEVQCTCASR